MAEERRLALERLRIICHSGLVSITDFRSNALNIFAAHEMAAFADVSMATKMTVCSAACASACDPLAISWA